MSDSNEQALGRDRASYGSPDHSSHHAPDPPWEALARAWLSTLPEGHALTSSEVEAWLASNRADLPEEIRSLPSSQLLDRLASIQNSLKLFNQEIEGNDAGIPHARFQRTDQWRPIYSWLESLNKDELVNSKDIADWLSDNPHVKEQLSSRHSRYHLMHYIKKCHAKILKRKEKKSLQLSNNATAVKVQSPGMAKKAVIQPYTNSSGNEAKDLPQDSDAYIAKRNEAFRKYEILLELEKQLTPIFAKQ